jgi:hypothetical protein
MMPVEIWQALNEGLGVNAVCRVFGVSKNSLYRWQERLSALKPTLLLYALCHEFLNLMVEGDELYTKVQKNVPPEDAQGWTESGRSQSLKRFADTPGQGTWYFGRLGPRLGARDPSFLTRT